MIVLKRYLFEIKLNNRIYWSELSSRDAKVSAAINLYSYIFVPSAMVGIVAFYIFGFCG